MLHIEVLVGSMVTQCELLQRHTSPAFHRHSVGTRHPIDQQHFAYGMLEVIIVIFAAVGWITERTSDV